jgi:energy-coupling factor transport system permease protein
VIYRKRASPLHAARAAAAGAYCLALATATFAFSHPVVLLALLVIVVAGGTAAGVRSELARAARYALPLALLIAAINPFVVRHGLTVVARLGALPPFGQVDITLEAIAQGGVLGIRALVLILCFALATAAIDPDEVLRTMRRVSFRSALTASLATRMVPVLARDGRRLADAQRCRPDAPSGTTARVALVRAVAQGALERAVDVAAALELRGYGIARRPGRRPQPWSRHDIAFLAAALGIAALGLYARVADVAPFHPYPLLDMPLGWGVAALALALLAVALAPFADRRGIA